MIRKSRVIKGKGRGARIGIPTLNFTIPEPFPYPHGVYAGWVYERGTRHRAAFHYGPVPTFNENTVSLEAFVIDGTTINNNEPSIELVIFIRPIQKFPTTEALQLAIENDVSVTETLTA